MVSLWQPQEKDQGGITEMITTPLFICVCLLHLYLLQAMTIAI